MAGVEYATSSNNALNIRLVRAPEDEAELASDEERALTSTWHPAFTYPIFGEEEKIYGYQDLKIKLSMASGSLKPLLEVEYAKKLDSADDVEEKLKEFLSLDSAITPSNFPSVVESEATSFRPPGELIHSYSRPSAKSEGKGKGKRRRLDEAGAAAEGEEGDVAYEVWKTEWDTPGWRELHRRMQVFVLLFIEGGSYLQEDEDAWEFVTLYERRSRPDGTNVYHFVGYSSLYPFYHYPSGKRMRLSQFVILPPYQHQGHGSALYRAIRAHVLSRPEVAELSVEDPSEAFEDLRDRCDLRYMLDNAVIGPELKAPLEKGWMDAQRKKHKIANRQFARLVEMVLLRKLDPKNKPEARAYRLLVKERLYRFNYELLMQISKDERKEQLQATYGNVIEGYQRALRMVA